MASLAVTIEPPPSNADELDLATLRMRLADERARIKSLVAENDALRAQAAAFSRLGVAGDVESGVLWAAMHLGVNGSRAMRPIVRAEPGASGVILYGPYQKLAAGAYRLDLALSAQRVKPDGELTIGAIDVVYGDIVIARRRLLLPENRHFSLHFRISAATAKLLSGAAYEFRVFSSGLYHIEICDLQLSRLAEDAVNPTLIDLLDLVTLGSAAEPGTGIQQEIVSSANASGHVFYGPYARLAPGVYTLQLDCVAEFSRPDSEIVVLDVVDADDKPIASREYRLIHGRQVLELEFDIPNPSALEQLRSGLEFRAGQRVGMKLTALSLTCLAHEETGRNR